MTVNPLSLDNVPARLSASGAVLTVNKKRRTFTISVEQAMVGASALGRLGIQAVMDLNVMWDVASERVPQIGSLVSLSGDLIGVKQGVAIVALDDLARLPPRRPHVCAPTGFTH